MYDVRKMRRDLELALTEVYRPIRDEFTRAFRDIYRGQLYLMSLIPVVPVS
jgi:hypothetical protein